MSHVFLSSSNLMGEYLYYLLEQKGIRPNMLDEFTRNSIIQATGKTKGIKKGDILNLNLNILNEIFDQHISYKLMTKPQFDTFSLPSVLSKNKFKNRSPLEIKEEKDPRNFSLIKDILEKGFPLRAEEELYVFYLPLSVNNQVYHHFYQGKKNLQHLERIRLDRYEVRLELKQGREHLNTLIFLLSYYSILAELKISSSVDKIIIWKKSTGEGSFFEISNLKFIEKLFGSSPRNSHLAKFLAYLFILEGCFREKGWKTDIVDGLMEKFSYYLLVKNYLDFNVVENVVRISVALWKEDRKIKNINKKFMINIMKEISYKENLGDYFLLGQLFRNNIYAVAKGNLEDALKLIDRLAKDLRNEMLPGNFLETLARDLIWLEGRGFRVSKEISEKLSILSKELRVCDLSSFYLIKASIILGLISPLSEEIKND